MTRKSIKEYAAAVRPRYLNASKAQKRVILTEFCETTGYHRKSAIRLLRHPPKRSGKRRGRRREYGSDVARALRVAWEATDRVCSDCCTLVAGAEAGVGVPIAAPKVGVPGEIEHRKRC